MKHITATIVAKYVRPGDKNPNVKVYGIVDHTGKVTETCGNYGNHQTYKDPIGNWKSVEVGKEYTYAYGSRVSYAHDTLLGVQV